MIVLVFIVFCFLKLCYIFGMLKRMPAYSLYPIVGPHTMVASKSRLYGSAADTTGFFCLKLVRFSPPA